MSLEHTPARRQRKRRDHGSTAQLAFTVDEFCDAHRISRTHLYAMWRQGLGPRYMLTGAKRLIAIEAAADWRAEAENSTSNHRQGKHGRGGNRRGGEAA